MTRKRYDPIPGQKKKKKKETQANAFRTIIFSSVLAAQNCDTNEILGNARNFFLLTMCSGEICAFRNFPLVPAATASAPPSSAALSVPSLSSFTPALRLVAAGRFGLGN